MALETSIAIDGPAGSGKSTIARMLSAATGLPYLSTGEMYRAIALCVLRHGIDPSSGSAATKCASGFAITARPDGSGGFRIFSGIEDVTDLLSTPEISRAASAVAVHAGVRSNMVAIQRAVASTDDIIMDGRDIGTVVLKESARKVYLDAGVEERARRRFKDYAGKGLTFEQVLADLIERDKRDSSREVDPLRPAEDAFILDTTFLSPEQVVDAILTRFGMRPGGMKDA